MVTTNNITTLYNLKVKFFRALKQFYGEKVDPKVDSRSKTIKRKKDQPDDG